MRSFVALAAFLCLQATNAVPLFGLGGAGGAAPGVGGFNCANTEGFLALGLLNKVTCINDGTPAPPPNQILPGVSIGSGILPGLGGGPPPPMPPPGAGAAPGFGPPPPGYGPPPPMGGGYSSSPAGYSAGMPGGGMPGGPPPPAWQSQSQGQSQQQSMWKKSKDGNQSDNKA